MTMTRDPVNIPLGPGVYALVNKRRRQAYVAYTGNLQKRSHAMSHMLLSHDRAPTKTYWSIAGLPKNPSEEFTFVVLKTAVTEKQARAVVEHVQQTFKTKGYTVVEGNRTAATLKVDLKDGYGKQLVVDLCETHELKYLTVYRRLERGWTGRQAFGLDPPDPRWDQKKTAQRRGRAA